MVTYKWNIDGGVVYINGVTAKTETSYDVDVAREYASTLVNDEISFMNAFNKNVKPLLNNGKEYSDYYMADDSCAYGICSVCTTMHTTEDGIPRVTSKIIGVGSRVLYIDFYNIIGQNGTNGENAIGQYFHIAYAKDTKDGKVLVERDGEYVGTCYNSYMEGSQEWNAISGNTELYTWTRIASVGISGSTEIEYKVSWNDLDEESKNQLKEELRGQKGADGNDGTRGSSVFKSIVFRRSNNDNVNKPIGGSYFNPIPDVVGGIVWYDGVPESDENGNSSAALWMSTRVFTSDGKAPQEADWTSPVIVSDSDTMDFEFSSQASQPANPTKERPGDVSVDGIWSNEATSESIWMAMRHVKNGEYVGNWSISKIKGEDGEAGKGIDVRYAYDTIEDFLEVWAYEGAAYDKTFDVFSGTWRDPKTVDSDFVDSWCVKAGSFLWTWDGSDGWINLGAYNGGTFMHIKYANKISQEEYVNINNSDISGYIDSLGLYLAFTSAGTGDLVVYGEDSGKYIGILTDNDEKDVLDISRYTWRQWQGNDGFGREYIFKVTQTETAPVVPTQDNDNITDWSNFQDADFVPVGWSDDVISVSEDYPFIWLCTRTILNGEWSEFSGDKNNPGYAALWSKYAKDGEDGITPELPTAQFTTIIFKRGNNIVPADELSALNANLEDLENYGSYINPLPDYISNDLGWSDTIPTGTGVVWMSSRVLYTNDDLTKTSSWSMPVCVNDSEFVDYEWTNYPVESGTPSIPSKTDPDSTASELIATINNVEYRWYDEPISGATFMAVREVLKGAYTGDWVISQIKGESGQDGTSISPKGKYDTLEEFANEWINGTYTISGSGQDKIAILSDGSLWISPTDDSKGGTLNDAYVVEGCMYVWDGSDEWINIGQFKGEPGQSAWLHIKYATDSTATTASDSVMQVNINGISKWIEFTESNGEQPGKYMGTRSDSTFEDTNVISAYTWVKCVGQDGFGYEYIYALTSTSGAPVVPVYNENPSNDGEFSGDTSVEDFVPVVISDRNIVWHDNPQGVSSSMPYCWMAYRVRKDGVWGAFSGDENGNAILWTKYAFDGVSPELPDAQYTSIIFKRGNNVNVDDEYTSLNGLSDNGSYENPAPTSLNSIGWYDTIPSGTGVVWMSSRVFYTSSALTENSNWTKPVPVNDSDTVDYEWTNYPLGKGNPTAPNKTNPKDSGTSLIDTINSVNYYWHDEPINNATFMAVRRIQGGEYIDSSWSISQIKGENGQDGTSISPKDSYATLELFANDWVNGSYTITGTGEDKHVVVSAGSSWISPIDESKGGTLNDAYVVEGFMYVWNGSDTWINIGRFKGEPGQSAWLHIKYANDTDKVVASNSVMNTEINGVNKWIEFTESNGEKPGTYMGTRSDSNQEDINIISGYTWVRCVGQDGFGYEYIYTLTSTSGAPLVPIYRENPLNEGEYSGNTNNEDFVPNVVTTNGIVWHDNPQSVSDAMPYCWMAYRVRKNGSWGGFSGSTDGHATLWSKYAFDGIAPETTYTSFIFKKSNSLNAQDELAALNSSDHRDEFGTYTTPFTTYLASLGWSDSIPETGEGDIWMSSRKFSTNEANIYLWSKPILAYDTSSIDYEWTNIPVEIAKEISGGLKCDKANPSVTTNIEISGVTGDTTYYWYDEPINDATYMAIREISGDVYKSNSTWKITQIKGESGSNGITVRISDAWTGEKLSLSAGTSEAEMHLCCSAYTPEGTCELLPTGANSFIEGHMYSWDGDNWEDVGLWQGSQGEPGIPGEPGEPGTPGAPGEKAVVHIKYANDSSFDTPVTDEIVGVSSYPNYYLTGLSKYIVWTQSYGEEPGKYLGIYCDNTEADSEDYSSYKWTKAEGEDGWGYEYIYALTSTENAPLVPIKASVSEWESFGDSGLRIGRYSGGTVNGTVYDSSHASSMADFVPLTEEIVWHDNAQSPTSANPYCWVCYRVKKDGEWGDFKGVENNDTVEAALWSRYAKDGEKGENGKDGNSGQNLIGEFNIVDGSIAGNVEYTLSNASIKVKNTDNNLFEKSTIKIEINYFDYDDVEHNIVNYTVLNTGNVIGENTVIYKSEGLSLNPNNDIVAAHVKYVNIVIEYDLGKLLAFRLVDIPDFNKRYSFQYRVNSTDYPSAIINLKFELGDVCTDWALAPQDLANALYNITQTSVSALTVVNMAIEDSYLTPKEKAELLAELSVIEGQYNRLVSEASAVGVSYTALTSAYNAIKDYERYLNEPGVSRINSSTLNTLFLNWYAEQVIVSELISKASSDSVRDYVNTIKSDLENQIDGVVNTYNGIGEPKLSFSYLPMRDWLDEIDGLDEQDAEDYREEDGYELALNNSSVISMLKNHIGDTYTDIGESTKLTWDGFEFGKRIAFEYFSNNFYMDEILGSGDPTDFTSTTDLQTSNGYFDVNELSLEIFKLNPSIDIEGLIFNFIFFDDNEVTNKKTVARYVEDGESIVQIPNPSRYKRFGLWIQGVSGIDAMIFKDSVNFEIHQSKTYGQSWRFCDNEDTDPTTFHWHLIGDNQTSQALLLAQTAKDLADGKRRIFITEPTAPYDDGDLWVNLSQDGLIKVSVSGRTDKFYESDWVDTINQNLIDMSSDGKFTPQEKLVILRDWNAIQISYNEVTKMAQMEAVNHNTIDSAKECLYAYLYGEQCNTISLPDDAPLSNMSTTSNCTKICEQDDLGEEYIGMSFLEYLTNEYKKAEDSLRKDINLRLSIICGAENNVGDKGIISIPCTSLKIINNGELSPGKYLFTFDRLVFQEGGTLDLKYGYGTRLLNDGIRTSGSTTIVTTLSGNSSNASAINFKLAFEITGTTKDNVYYLFGDYNSFDSENEDDDVAIVNPALYKLDSNNSYMGHIRKALQGATDISGGLVLTNVIMLRDESNRVVAGISGLDKPSETSNGITLWGGGTYAQAQYDALKTTSATSSLPILLTKNGIGSKVGCFKVVDKDTVTIGSDTLGVITLKSGDNGAIESSSSGGTIVLKSGNDGGLFMYSGSNVTSTSEPNVSIKNDEITIPDNSMNLETFTAYPKVGLFYGLSVTHTGITATGNTELELFDNFKFSANTDNRIEIYLSTTGTYTTNKDYTVSFKVILQSKRVNELIWHDETVLIDFIHSLNNNNSHELNEVRRAKVYVRKGYMYRVIITNTQGFISATHGENGAEGLFFNLIRRKYIVPYELESSIKIGRNGISSFKDTNNGFAIYSNNTGQHMVFNGLRSKMYTDSTLHSGEIYTDLKFINSMSSFLTELSYFVSVVRTVGTNSTNSNTLIEAINDLKNRLADSNILSIK